VLDPVAEISAYCRIVGSLGVAAFSVSIDTQQLALCRCWDKRVLINGREAPLELEIDILRRYQDELEEIARLDQSYYLNKTPSRGERASYAVRQERLKRARSNFNATLSPLRQQEHVAMETVQLHFKDKACGTEVSSSPQCLLAHDFNNLLGVVLGRCELLGSVMPNDKAAAYHLSKIVDAAQRMAGRIHGGACKFFISRDLG